MKWKAYFGMNRVSFFFFKILYYIFFSNYDMVIRQCFRSNWEVKALSRRSVLIWVNCPEDILIIYFFLYVILLALCVTLFLLINSLNFRICLFFVNSKDFLYEFSWIFSTRWNSSGVIDSKILPLTVRCYSWAYPAVQT